MNWKLFNVKLSWIPPNNTLYDLSTHQQNQQVPVLAKNDILGLYGLSRAVNMLQL